MSVESMDSSSDDPASGLIIFDARDTDTSQHFPKVILTETAAASKDCREIYYDYFLGGEKLEDGEKLIKTWQEALGRQSVHERTASDTESCSNDWKQGKYTAWVGDRRFTIGVAEFSTHAFENKITESLCKPQPLNGGDVAYDFVDICISVMTFASDPGRPIISVAPLAKEYSPKAWWQTSLALQNNLNGVVWNDESVLTNSSFDVTHSGQFLTPSHLITKAKSFIAKAGLDPEACVMQVSIADTTTTQLDSSSDPVDIIEVPSQ